MKKKLIKKVRKEIRKKMKKYRGNWIAIHRNTANHILEVTDKRKNKYAR